MTFTEALEQAICDQQRMEAAQAESRRQQAAMDAFNAGFQAMWAVHCAQMSVLIYRGMFDPNFCKPTQLGKEANHER